MGTQIVEVISSIFGLIPELFTELSAIFWNPGTGDAAGSFTFIGTLSMLGLGLMLCFVVFRMIRGFMHLRG